MGLDVSIIAGILRTTAANVTEERLVRPQIGLCPPQRHRAVLWVLAQYLSFRMKWKMEVVSFVK